VRSAYGSTKKYMIGLFDSGLGGLSIARAVQAVLPAHNLLYLADSAYCPYGPRPIAEIRARSLICARWLVDQGAQMVVVACNTATAAAVHVLRAELPVPVVGTEPGVKPAAAATRSGKVAVLATNSTLASDRLTYLVERFGKQVRVETVACPALVDLVERGELSGPQAVAAVASYIGPLCAADVDTFVLGCTHFPWLASLIRAAAGPEATIIDTGPAVARQVARIAAERGLTVGNGRFRVATTGEVAVVQPAFRRIWDAAAIEWAEVSVEDGSGRLASRPYDGLGGL
jgi:glutamate racemase